MRRQFLLEQSRAQYSSRRNSLPMTATEYNEEIAKTERMGERLAPPPTPLTYKVEKWRFPDSKGEATLSFEKKDKSGSSEDQAEQKFINFVQWYNWIFWSDNDFEQTVPNRHGHKIMVPIHPYSRFFQTWEFCSGVLLLYSSIVTPVLLSLFSEGMGYCEHSPTIGFDMFVDLFFWMEIVVHCLTGKVVLGVYVFTISEVMHRYILHGDFLRDVLSASPIAWIEFFNSPNLSCSDLALQDEESSIIIRYLRFIRFLKLLRLFKVLKIFDVCRDVFGITPAYIRLIKLGFTVFLMCHINGCLWWFIKMQSNDEEALMEFRVSHGILEKDAGAVYLLAIYFCMATLSTVGYGDISGSNQLERAFVVFLMFMGATVFAIVVSNLSAVIATLQSRESMLQEEMEGVVDYLSKHGSSPNHIRNVRNFYTFCQRQSTAFTQEIIKLHRLPPALHRTIVTELNRHFVAAAWIFDGLSESEVFEVVEQFEIQLGVPDEIIVDEKHQARGIYIIIAGNVDLQIKKGGDYQVVDTLSRGDIFAEVSVIRQSPCPYRAKAVGYVELFLLPAQKALEILEESPEMHRRLRLGADEIQREYDLLRLKNPGSIIGDPQVALF